MKTIEQFLKEICGVLNWDYSELKESYPELIEEATETAKSFIREAIKADRENVAEYAVAKENPSDFGTGEIWVDRNSIINAPQIELL